MPQISLHHQTRQEPDRRDDASGDEQRLEDIRCDVRYVRDGLPRLHRDIYRSPLGEPCDEQREEGGEPYDGGDDGYPGI